MSYEIGKVYIWNSRANPAIAKLYGTECTVLASGQWYEATDDIRHYGWLTDSQMPSVNAEHQVFAHLGDLRPKNPPKGEQSILDTFKVPAPELEPA